MNNKSLDLHGIRHENVRQKVINFVEDNWDTTNDLEIITGHSIKMQKIVLNVLNEYKLCYIIGDMFNKQLPKITFWF